MLGMKRAQSRAVKDRGGQGTECPEYKSVSEAQGPTLGETTSDSSKTS